MHGLPCWRCRLPGTDLVTDRLLCPASDCSLHSLCALIHVRLLAMHGKPGVINSDFIMSGDDIMHQCVAGLANERRALPVQEWHQMRSQMKHCWRQSRDCRHF